MRKPEWRCCKRCPLTSSSAAIEGALSPYPRSRARIRKYRVSSKELSAILKMRQWSHKILQSLFAAVSRQSLQYTMRDGVHGEYRKLFCGLAGCPPLQPCAKLQRRDPQETRERLRKALPFAAFEPDPCEPLRNLLGDRWARGGWRRRGESLLQPLQPAEDRLHCFSPQRYRRPAKPGRTPPASRALPVGRPPAPGMMNRGPSSSLPSGET